MRTVSCTATSLDGFIADECEDLTGCSPRPATPTTPAAAGKPLLPRRLRLHRERVERDGQRTAMLFRVIGPGT